MIIPPVQVHNSLPEPMLKKVFYFIIGLLLMAIGFNTFLKDLNIAQGVSGIALMFERTLGYDTSLVILVANVIFLILGVIFLGVKVTRSCIPESILFPLFVKITEWITIDFGKTSIVNTIITCEHRERCCSIKNFLEEEKK